MNYGSHNDRRKTLRKEITKKGENPTMKKIVLEEIKKRMKMASV